MTQFNNSKTLFFISAGKAEVCHAACAIFDAEAAKMDVAWTSATVEKTENGISYLQKPEVQAALKKADLLVLLQPPAGKDTVKSLIPSFNGKAESWTIPDDDRMNDELQNQVSALMVRLILQGGKRQPLAPVASAKKSADHDPSKDTVRVARESKGRGGKTVTVITGLTLDESKLKDLATKLKQVCGTGGTIKDGNIEIQGDQCDRILKELQSRGYKAKRSGG